MGASTAGEGAGDDDGARGETLCRRGRDGRAALAGARRRGSGTAESCGGATVQAADHGGLCGSGREGWRRVLGAGGHGDQHLETDVVVAASVLMHAHAIGDAGGGRRAAGGLRGAGIFQKASSAAQPQERYLIYLNPLIARPTGCCATTLPILAAPERDSMPALPSSTEYGVHASQLIY